MTKRKYFDWSPEWTAADRKEIKTLARELDRNVSAMRAFREQFGISQKEFAEILGVSQSNVSKMEAKAEPRLAALRKLIEHKGGRLKLVAEMDGKETEVPFFP